MALSIDEVTSQVPRMAGFHWVGCPNCDGGVQENALEWHFGMGDTVRCRYCGMTYPNEKFPMNKQVRIVAPNGDVQIYRYYENAKGRQYYLESLAWFERMLWMRAEAVKLATLYHYTGKPEYGDRAAAILARFAQVVPNYAVRYDFPFQRKRFFPANQRWPYEGIPAYRGSKFTRWAVSDIPEDLARAWDLLEGRYDYKRLGKRFGSDPSGLIQKDLLRYMVDFTTANPENQGNMSPGMYRMMLATGRVLDEPRYVHDAVKRFNNFIRDRYFADGWWMEGTSGYHSQTVSGLRQIALVAQGYSDPPGWTDPADGGRFDNLDLLRDDVRFNRARRVTQDAILPNGRALPINDTYGWASRSWSTTTSLSILWPGLGEAMLGAGTGDNQVCLAMNWSGNYGFHNHMDNGSIIPYACGHELLPDIGYTHTRWHNWIINSASHNMVVVDERSQPMRGPQGRTTQGNLRWFDSGDKHVQVLDLDAQPSYPICRPTGGAWRWCKPPKGSITSSIASTWTAARSTICSSTARPTKPAGWIPACRSGRPSSRSCRLGRPEGVSRRGRPRFRGQNLSRLRPADRHPVRARGRAVDGHVALQGLGAAGAHGRARGLDVVSLPVADDPPGAQR